MFNSFHKVKTSESDEDGVKAAGATTQLVIRISARA